MQHTYASTHLGKRFLTVQEAAAYLNLSPNTIYSWNSQGINLPVVKFGRRVVIDVNDLEAFIEASKRATARNVAEGERHGRVQ